MVARVDHVVLNVFQTGIAAAGMQFGLAISGFGFEQQLAIGLRNDHIVVTVDMLTRLRPRGKTPFSDDHAIIRYLLRCYGPGTGHSSPCIGCGLTA